MNGPARHDRISRFWGPPKGTELHRFPGSASYQPNSFPKLCFPYQKRNVFHAFVNGPARHDKISRFRGPPKGTELHRFPGSASYRPNNFSKHCFPCQKAMVVWTRTNRTEPTKSYEIRTDEIRTDQNRTVQIRTAEPGVNLLLPGE